MINVSPNWTSQLPEALVGLLVINNAPNKPDHPALQKAKLELEEELRSRYAGMDRKTLRQEPVLAAYDAFYRQFRKSYHVQLQLESIAFKGKPIFSPSALVTCMFLAELNTGLLTAAHDVAAVEFPLVAEIATGEETYQLLSGAEQGLKEGDMYIKDQCSILSSVIYGPDQRTQITTTTVNAAYTTYGPPGISAALIKEQLEILESYVRLFAPDVKREQLVVI
jgi:DNA/RNA-binding domain of Phe-tRNA-synthetase-like protein